MCSNRHLQYFIPSFLPYQPLYRSSSPPCSEQQRHLPFISNASLFFHESRLSLLKNLKSFCASFFTNIFWSFGTGQYLFSHSNLRFIDTVLSPHAVRQLLPRNNQYLFASPQPLPHTDSLSLTKSAYSIYNLSSILFSYSHCCIITFLYYYIRSSTSLLNLSHTDSLSPHQVDDFLLCLFSNSLRNLSYRLRENEY